VRTLGTQCGAALPPLEFLHFCSDFLALCSFRDLNLSYPPLTQAAAA
jgi:hypothetical protein